MGKLSGAIMVADLKKDGPTELALAEISTWVVWQFPRPRRGGLCAALHPPEEQYGWIPGIVRLEQKRVEVHAHATGPFSTPEEAVEWMERA